MTKAGRQLLPPLLAALLALSCISRQAEAAPAPANITSEWFQAMSNAYNYGNATADDLKASRLLCDEHESAHWAVFSLFDMCSGENGQSMKPHFLSLEQQGGWKSRRSR